MKKIFILALLTVFAIGAYAAGGKNQTKESNPNVLDDGDTQAFYPPGVDTSVCTNVPAPDQSGVVVSFCEAAFLSEPVIIISK